ncbi:hypothetical protein ABTN05_20070, partial [Acinetobacter baumannii]
QGRYHGDISPGQTLGDFEYFAGRQNGFLVKATALSNARVLFIPDSEVKLFVKTVVVDPYHQVISNLLREAYAKAVRTARLHSKADNG